MTLIDSPAWRALQAHFEQMRTVHMRDLFIRDPGRFPRMTARLNDILFDYSKNRITDETLSLLLDLAHQCDVEGWRERMFRGEPINHTEHRPVLHVALRNMTDMPCLVDGEDVMPEIRRERERMFDLARRIRSGTWLGATGEQITDIVNIGVGGSHLGPEMVTQALRPYAARQPRLHFLNNIDENHICNTLEGLRPETTLFIIASKSFTTRDTMLNAESAREWLLQYLDGEVELSQHLIAVTANTEAAVAFGIDPQHVFRMWDWVGGRYSLWSSIGLPIVIAIGPERFMQLLEGAWLADRHFRETPLDDNIPVLMALIGIWYNNFFGTQSIAILPYDQNMHRFPAYLQQADMESNGKSRDRAGGVVDYQTGPVLFGEIGISGQHAFYQLLHQGTTVVPADILVPARNFRCIARHHRALMANALAQAEALMRGRTEEEAIEEMRAEGLDEEHIRELLPYRVFPGNRPTNTFLFHTLDPKTLGSLIALYEHKIFVQGVIWNINSFDQWGVELGKKLASNILDELNEGVPVQSHDSSTNGLINYYLELRQRQVERG